VGSAVSGVAFPLLVLALTGSPAQAGLVGFLERLPQLLFNLPAGVYVDRWNRKLAMVLCDVGRALALGSIPVALLTHRLSLLQLAVVAFVEGSLAVVFSLAEGAAVPRLVAKEQLPAAYAQNEAISRSSGMIGQPLGGLLFGLGQLFPFVADAISYAVSVVSLLFIRAEFEGERRVAGGRSLRAELAEGVRWLWGQPFLRTSTLLVAGTNLIFAANYLAIIVLAQERQTSAATIGLIFGAGGIGGLLGAVLAGVLAKWLRLSWVVLSVNWLWALLWPLLAVAPTGAAIGAIYALMVFAGPFWNVVLGSYKRALVPDELQARVDGAGTTIAWGAIPLGSLLAGGLLQWVGPVDTIWILGALMLFIALAGTFSGSIRHAPPLAEVATPQS
jgi:predicted MFS family arabinose efflux permease